jgi:hypothetical protein
MSPSITDPAKQTRHRIEIILGRAIAALWSLGALAGLASAAYLLLRGGL